MLAGLAGLAGLGGCLGGDTAGSPTGSPVGSPPRSPSDSPTGSSSKTESPGDEPGVAWRRSLDGAVDEPPSVSDGAVVVGTEAGTINAFDETGDERWQVDTGQRPSGPTAIAGDTVLAVTGASPELGATWTLRAFALADGSERWTFTTDEQWGMELLGVEDGSVFVVSADDALEGVGESLYALDLATGDERWSREVGDPRGGLVTADAVYAPTIDRVYAYDHDGTHLWTVEDVDYQYRSLRAIDDVVGFAASSPDDPRQTTLYALDATSGDERWTFDDWFVTSLAVADGHLVAGGERVAGFDPATGDTQWQTEASGSVYGAPTDGDLLFANGVTAVRTTDGEAVWQFGQEEHLALADATVDDTLLIRVSASRDDRNRLVYGVATGNGAERWSFEADAELTRLTTDRRTDLAFAGSEAGRLYAFAPA